MQFARNMTIISLLVSLVACAPMPARYDLDAETDFSQYHQYQWEKKSHSEKNLADNSLFQKRVEKNVDQILFGKGFNRVKDNSDFILGYRVTTQEKMEIRDYGYDYYWPYRYGNSIDSYSYTEGTLIIDMFDTKTGKLLWRGWVNRVVDPPSISPEMIEEMVDQILLNFPN